MKSYVVGFLFGTVVEHIKDVLLVKKLKPEWQAGYWNGIGGKMEKGESPVEALVREFREETGISTRPLEWAHMVTLVCPGGTVFFFRAYAPTDIFEGFPRNNDNGEEIDWQEIEGLPENTITNLRWLVPFCAYQKLEHPIFVHEDMKYYACKRRERNNEAD